MSVFVSEKQDTRQSAQILMFKLSVDQTIIKSVDAAVIAAAPGPDWPLPLLIPSLVFLRLLRIFQLELITGDFGITTNSSIKSLCPMIKFAILLLSLETVVESLMRSVGSLPSKSVMFNMHGVSP